MTTPAGGSSETPIKLSIIVPSYNEELRLPLSLDRIAAYVAGSARSAEVLVVDDGSQDKTADVAASYADRVLFLADGRVVDEMADPSAERVLARMAEFDAAGRRT